MRYPLAPMRTDDTRKALAVTLGELEGWLGRVQDGEVVVVPDGLLGTVERLRSDLTATIGPRDAGDLAWMLREILRRLERLESMTFAGRCREVRGRVARRWRAVRGAVTHLLFRPELAALSPWRSR